MAEFKMTAAQAKRLQARLDAVEKDNKALRKEISEGKKKPEPKKEEAKEEPEEKPKKKGFLSFLD